jgi:uncharacterized repeat protein (TIGR01451 family)
MRRVWKARLLAAGLFVTLTAALAVAGAASARVNTCSSSAGGLSALHYPTVIHIDGAANKTCDDLDTYGATGASWLELKFDTGDLPSVGSSKTLSDSYLSVTLSQTATDVWSWTSTKGIDAVLVKSGASGHNLYVYDPPTEATSGTGLTVPGDNGTSHVAFCYDKEQTPPGSLEISKSAAGRFDVQHNWTIDKQVKLAVAGDETYGDNAALSLADGGSGAVTWKVSVGESTTETNFVVNATIEVSNPNDQDVEGVDVSDPNGIVDCSPEEGAQDTGLTVPANGSITCSFVGMPESKIQTNTATVTWGDDQSASATATIAWSKGTDVGTPAVVSDDGAIDDEVVDGAWTTTYDEAWTCDAGTPSPNEGRTNTATVVWDGGSDADSASAAVTCGQTPPTTPPATPHGGESMDVQVVKDATPQVELVNGQAEITYTIVVSNAGPNQAHNVVLSDAAPSGVTFLAVVTQPANGSCAVTPALLDCSLGTLGPGVARTIVVSARVTQTGIYVNSATGTGDGGDTNPANNTDTAQTLVTAPLTPPVMTPPATPKPKPHAKPKPKPGLAICRILKVSTTMVKANGKRHVLVAKVTRSRNPVQGVKVRFKGAGVSKSARTNRKGTARIGIRTIQAGIIRVDIVNAKACNTARIGVVGVFQPPVTG